MRNAYRKGSLAYSDKQLQIVLKRPNISKAKKKLVKLW
jgi:hypothetical protein